MNDCPEPSAGAIERGLELMRWQLIQHRPARTAGRALVNPLQWAARVLSDWKYRLRVALTVPPLEEVRSEQLKRAEQDRARLAHEYSEGYITGWRECFDSCVQAVEDEFASADDVWRLGASLIGSGKSRQDN